jgi:hypothetical protein
MWTLKIDNKELLLSDEPLPTWPFGNLGDVAQINVLSTRSVRIPSNPTSDVFFEHINRFNVNSDLPTRQVVVSVLYYGEPVIYNGIVEKIEYSGQDYTVIISGDNGVLRSLLKDTLQALDWSAYTIPYTDAQISDDLFVGGGSFPVPVTPALTYANAWRSKNFDDGLLYDGIPTTDAQQRILCLPGVQLATVLSEILLQNGLQQIDLSNTDFLNLPEFSELYLAFSTINMNQIGRAHV